MLITYVMSVISGTATANKTPTINAAFENSSRNGMYLSKTEFFRLEGLLSMLLSLRLPSLSSGETAL